MLHNPDGPHLHRFAALRARFSQRLFPLTAGTHGLSHPFQRWEIFARLLLTPLAPCDSILCTSKPARDAFLTTLEQVREGLLAAGTTVKHSQVRLDLLPLGVDTQLYRPRDRQDVRQILALPQNKTLLLYFGRMDARSKADLHPLLLAFRELLQTCDQDLVLLLAGGATQSQFQELSQAAIRLGIQDRMMIWSVVMLWLIRYDLLAVNLA